MTFFLGSFGRGILVKLLLLRHLVLVLVSTQVELVGPILEITFLFIQGAKTIIFCVFLAFGQGFGVAIAR